MRKFFKHINLLSPIKQKGQGIVEYVFIAPLLVLFFCGIFDLGIFAMKAYTVSNATCDLCRTVQIQPAMLEDEDAQVSYVTQAFPSLSATKMNIVAETDNDRLNSVEEVSGVHKEQYLHHFFYMDGEDNLKELEPGRISTTSTQPIIVSIEYTDSYVTALGPFLNYLGGEGFDNEYTIKFDYLGSIDRTVDQGDW